MKSALTTTVIETQKGSIEYSQYGSGIPIVFFHGGHGNSVETLFHKGFEPSRFCLITPSRPGYCKTSLAGNESPEATAELFVGLLDRLEISKAIVVGISAGGLSAIAFAAQYPERVRQLILISAVTKRWMTDQDANYRRGKRLFSPRMERFSWGLFRGMYRLMPKRMAATMFKELSKKRPVEILGGEVAELQSMINLQRSHAGFCNDLDQTIDDAQLGRIAVPTLILHSRNDPAVDMSHAQHAHAEIQGSELKTYDNRWGHLLWLGQESAHPIADTLAFLA